MQDNDHAEALATMDDGATILLRRQGPPAAERVVISHGNGLAIDGFARFAGALTARGFEVVAFDMRNHGRNPRHPVAGSNWRRFIADLPQILRGIDTAFGEKPTHGAFHSLSSAVCLLTQAETPYPWRSLTLFEPPVPPNADDPAHAVFLDYHRNLSERAGRRRAQFDTPDALFASMRRSSLFRLVPDADLERLARATLRPAPQGGWELSCPPEFEAATFRIDEIVALRPGLARVDCPVRLVLGDESIHYAHVLLDAGRALVRDFGFSAVELPLATHFMQLEHPETCAGLVAPDTPAT